MQVDPKGAVMGRGKVDSPNLGPPGSNLEGKIVAAAEKLFAQRGFHATGMRQIARNAGVSIGAIYHYFKSKEDILLAIVRREIDHRRGFLESLRKEGLPVPEQIRRIVEMHFARLQESRDRVQLLHREWRALTARLWQRLPALHEELADYLARLIDEGIAAGDIAPCHSTVAAYSIIGMVETVTHRALRGDAIGEQLIKRGAEELTRLLSRWLVRGEGG